MNYDEAIDWLERLNVFGIKPGLGRIRILLEKLGDPQLKYKTIHVAGTNGKGSVTAMISKMLSTAGISVGMFTSPHLSSYCERIKINDVDISEAEFADEVSRVKKIIESIIAEGGEHPTQFEALTAMAFDHFARAQVEYAVIEVGLGGLLDSTNVITPVVSIITNIGNDHADKCGGTLEGIARHKAGIIKRGVPLITGAKEEPLKIIRSTAKNLDAPIKILGENFFIDESLELSLDGDFQLENAALAIEAARMLNDPRLDHSKIVDALRLTRWKARFEHFTIENKTVIIDGAHNPDGVRALRKSLDVRFSSQPRRFMFGVLRDKDFDEMIKILFRTEDFVIVTRPNSARSAEPKLICERLSQHSIRAVSIENVRDAFDLWLDDGEENIVRIAAGSLYMIGAIRDFLVRWGVNGNEPRRCLRQSPTCKNA